MLVLKVQVIINTYGRTKVYTVFTNPNSMTESWIMFNVSTTVSHFLETYLTVAMGANKAKGK